MKTRGVLSAATTRSWRNTGTYRHNGPFDHVTLAPSAEEIANQLEIVRLLKEERALALQLRDMVVRMDALAENPRPGPDLTLAYDIECALQCLNDALTDL